jgi:hypothetical protein
MKVFHLKHTEVDSLMMRDLEVNFDDFRSRDLSEDQARLAQSADGFVRRSSAVALLAQTRLRGKLGRPFVCF